MDRTRSTGLPFCSLARVCGFSVEEMRQLLHGFRPGVTASQRWKEMARKKQADIDSQIATLRRMREILDRVAQCQCDELKECGRIALEEAVP